MFYETASNSVIIYQSKHLKNILGQKNFGSKSFCGSKIFWVIKIMGKKFWAKKKLGQKDLNPNFFLSKNNQVGLTQG